MFTSERACGQKIRPASKGKRLLWAIFSDEYFLPLYAFTRLHRFLSVCAHRITCKRELRGRNKSRKKCLEQRRFFCSCARGRRIKNVFTIHFYIGITKRDLYTPGYGLCTCQIFFYRNLLCGLQCKFYYFS